MSKAKKVRAPVGATDSECGMRVGMRGTKEWIGKLKEDVRLRGAGVGLIVTEAMPGDMQRFGEIDGIWICSFAEFKSVSLLLRLAMLRIGEVMAAQENKGDSTLV